MVVIAFHPYHFDIPLGIRQLADVSEKFPVLFGQASEVEVGKNVAQQDEPLEAILLKHAGRLARTTRLCTQVQVGEDQRVVHVRIHTFVVAGECYEVMKYALKSGQE